MKHLNRILMALPAVLVCGAATAEPRNHALLVGVSKYQYSEQLRNEGRKPMDLEGPENDVVALKDVLIRRWDFRPEDVVTLSNAQATRRGILQAIAELEKRSSPGDSVLIYLSGHGTNAIAGGAGAAVPHGSGAFVPYDFSQEAGVSSLLVGRTDLRPALERLDRGQRKTWVIADACYSGQMVRSVSASGGLPSRYLPVLGRDARTNLAQVDVLADRPVEPYPYTSTAFISAAAEGEVAADFTSQLLKRYPTRDGKAHGALTDALLRVLEGELPADADGSGQLSLEEAHRSMTAYLAAMGVGQSPQRLPSLAEDTSGLGQRAVLAATGKVAAPARRAPDPLSLVVQGDVPASVSGRLGSISGLRLRDKAPADLILAQRKGNVDLLTASLDLVTRVPADDAKGVLGSLQQFVWAKRLRQLAEQHQRAILPAEITPSVFGGNFLFGQKIAFVVKPDRNAYILLLNVDASGKVSVLFPGRRHELQPIPGGKARHIPGENPADQIVVQAPEGMDIQFIFAFDEAPPGIERLIGMQEAPATDPRLVALEELLPQMAGKYAFASTELRSLPGPQP